MSRAKVSDQQKKTEDDARLVRLWRAYHKERQDEALTGAHGAIVSEVIGLMETSSPGTLISTTRRHDWSAVNSDTRFTILHEINEAIVRMREAHGRRPSMTDSTMSRTVCFGSPIRSSFHLRRIINPGIQNLSREIMFVYPLQGVANSPPIERTPATGCRAHSTPV
jgi:hypothetical protein